ncbi:translation initiation factor IF-2 N-terminal domain-containing protein [Mycolicibacterium sp. 120266]|uniref:translation initiation factor IF-2 N-terminal domain-containing protein n=1 Tax=Mycolicibacterium sp. 120266 TaxID=3090601 RepID=UPI00299DA1F2|nr:Rne/Rng family ribonuclease [Mycolicibacterium sp. 120266]MDX1873943.1 translation initiation factor IF-2 N-terminal domain-containing protein [Mycolicibacterium sp. 120266]
MAEDAHTQDLSQPAQHEELPAKLRVHSLARVLGTTSKRIVDVLAELDGRARSPHSTVDKAEAERVRDVLTAAEAAENEPPVPTGSVEPAEVAEAVDVLTAEVTETTAAVDSQPDEPPVPTGSVEPSEVAEAVEVVTAEPESRLLLETPHAFELEVASELSPRADVEPAPYLPLFVAPQPVEFQPRVADADESDDTDEGDDADADVDDAEADGEDGQSDRPAARRRRRGRRGRGRGRGEQNPDEAGEDADAEGGTDTGEQAGGDDTDDAEDTDDDTGEEAGSSEGGSRRRRRRRRRKTGNGDNGDSEEGSPDDPPNTVVHERAPRERSGKSGKESDEIQGISGSTRLEAKRQRRRDGRDAGRRRPPILSEAEFLARREAVERTMIVRDKIRTEPPHEGARYTQIAVLEDGVVVEHFVTSAASASLVGNIYLGIVQNVLPSMEAAFVDIGRGRNGVLYAGEVNWEAAGLGGNNRKIEQALKPGDYVVVQVSKDPVGHKGARLTTQISLAGRYLVYVPGASSTGISRKLPDTERQRLKEILREVVPAGAGVIIRTASEGVKEEDIRADVERLQQRWTEIEARAAETTQKKAGAAIALYEEPDVLVKVIRDLFNEDFSGLIVSGDEAWNTINGYVNSVAPELVSRMTKYEPSTPDGPDVFAVHRIDEQLAKALDRKVWLPSGGTLVIDRTEAMTVVDVNTGKFTGAGGNLEQTVTKNNLEAAEEIVRQLRLRDIGGIVVIDFIDMVLESNRDLVLRRLTEALARDRTRHQVSEVTSLGLVQLTRKRLGTGLVEAFSTTCTHCAGRGIVLHVDPVDTAQAVARKAESGGGAGGGGGGGRRGKRGKKAAKPEEVQVAKVPAHAAGEHPMFKAMAAANGKHDDEDAEAFDDDTVDEGTGEDDAETITGADDELTAADGPEDANGIDDDVEDEFDDDSEDDDSEDDADEDEADDIDEDIDEDSDDDDDEFEDDEDEDSDDEDSDDEDEFEDDDSEDDDTDDDGTPAELGVVGDEPSAEAVTPAGRRPRRRAAARPAGPPGGAV